MNQIRLGKGKNINSVNQDSYINKSLDNTIRSIPVNDFERVLDLENLYNLERNVCEKYRLSFTINPVLTNVLTNLGVNGLSIFNNIEFRGLMNPLNNGINQKTIITYKESVNKHLIYENGWAGYYTYNGLSSDCFLNKLMPNDDVLALNNGQDTRNWFFNLYYIHDHQNLPNSGLSVIHSENVDYGGRVFKMFLSPINHNLNIGDRVYIGNIGTSSGVYTIYDVGNYDNELKQNYFVVELPTTDPISDLSNVYFRKSINGFLSSYYYRKLKRITNTNGTPFGINSYKISEMGYAKNVYGDTISQLIFNTDIDITNLVDNRKRRPMELILGVFKNRFSSNGVGVFTNLKSGLNLNYTGYFSNTIIDVRKINPLNYNHTMDSIINYNQDDLIYDVAEFNNYECKEYSLNKINYRFNTINREEDSNVTVTDHEATYNLGKRYEGYYYDPFYSIQIREESEEVYEGDEFDELPFHSVEYSEAMYRWREVLQKTDSTIQYPFVNGYHYINTDIILKQKRQDPFNKYGLFHNSFPFDRGGSSNNFDDDILIENINDEC